MTKTYSKINRIDDCSRPTTTSPGNFILISPPPDHHRHHPDQPWTTQSLPDRLALLQDHQLCSRYTQTNPGYTPCLSQPLQTITTVTHHSRTTMDQSKPPRLLQKTMTHSWTTLLSSTVPNQPRPFWPLHTLIPTSPDSQSHQPSFYIPTMGQSSTEPSWSTESTI